MKFFIGPCVLESRDLAFLITETLTKNLESELKNGDIQLVFKGSYDKANRTSIDSYRGPGLEEGLKILEAIKKTFGLPVVTDIHLPEQALPVAEVVDYIQIPAFLCRQTDLIIAGAQACQKFGRTLKVKKGQFLAPEDTKNIVDKAKNFLPLDRILLTERGASFGYNNLVVDMASFQIMKSFGVKTVYDATHSVQRPGGLGNITGGKREQVKVLARAAVAAGADAVFMETHPNPDRALSDSTTALDLKIIPGLVRELLAFHQLGAKFA